MKTEEEIQAEYDKLLKHIDSCETCQGGKKRSHQGVDHVAEIITRLYTLEWVLTPSRKFPIPIKW
jgi:hypothetical protein